jgi:hypothetical protein
MATYPYELMNASLSLTRKFFDLFMRLEVLDHVLDLDLTKIWYGEGPKPVVNMVRLKEITNDLSQQQHTVFGTRANFLKTSRIVTKSL